MRAPMRYLPVLATADIELRLPASDRSAARLTTALLSDDLEVRAVEIRAALADDPPLALWAICLAAGAGFRGLRTLATLAEWLAGGGLLAAFGHDHPLESASAASATIWRDRAAHAVRIARKAAELACSADADAERIYLLALLSDVPEWLAAKGVAGARTNSLPAWLIDSWGEIESAPGAVNSPAQCVAAARKIVDAEAPPPVVVAGEQWPTDDASVDQLASLARRLLRLEQLERDFAGVVHTAKLDALKELAYGASHEINNPLANISARAQALLEGEGDPQRRRTLASIHAQALRAHEMIGDMMLFARPPKPKLARIDLAALVARVIAELTPGAEDQGTQLLLHARVRALAVEADATQLAVAVRALCVNALEALVSYGRVEVTLSRADGTTEKLRANLASAQITVADTGPGIPESVREHLFDPFFSGREAGRGLGFGLSKCWRIVTLHGGQVQVSGAPGGGASFTVTLPLAEDA